MTDSFFKKGAIFWGILLGGGAGNAPQKSPPLPLDIRVIP
jgi:hypothetical protein